MNSKKPKPKDQSAERPRQEVTSVVVFELLRVIRNQFFPDLSDDEWFKGNYQFVRRKVVFWPAAFMAKKGFTLPVERYQEIFLNILNEIKTHGRTEAVKFWPGYLLKCVQSHWQHQWEEYYKEAKSVRNKADLILAGVVRAQAGVVASESTQAMAIAYSISKGPKGKRARPVAKESEQVLPGF